MSKDARNARDTTIEIPDPFDSEGIDQKEYRRVLFSSFLGSAIEYYDFLLYGTAAALVFGPLFFSGQTDAVALIASFATFAVGYLARPLGGIVFGHLGDTIGRKATLVITMVMMGIASTMIGLLPTSAQIGGWAAILLVLLRVFQGLAVGGEWGGAALMALEHSPSKQRGFSASFANMGGPAGAFLATIVFALFSTLPREAFLSWGWRIPFLFSAALVVVGLFIRLKVTESPVFLKAQELVEETQAKQKLAIVTVLKRYPKELIAASTAAIAALAFQTFMATFAISMATHAGVAASTVLLIKAAAAVLHVFTIPFFAWLSDRHGRKKIMLLGAGAAVLFAYPLIMLLASGDPFLVLLGFILGNPILQAAMYGPLAAYISEMFGTEARYTGAGLGYQLGSTVGGGFTPLIASSLWAVGIAVVASTGWEQYSLVAIYLIAGTIITMISLALSKETKDRNLDLAGAVR